MGPPGMGPGQFHPSEQEQQQPPHPHQQVYFTETNIFDIQHQMMPPMHSNQHLPGAHAGPGPMSAPPPGPQMGPHQLPPHPMFPGAFPRFFLLILAIIDFTSSPFSRQPGPLIMFPPPSIPQPPFLEFRLQEMNRRLYQFHCQFHQQVFPQYLKIGRLCGYHCLFQAPSENQEQWWDAFAQEFFDDNSRMTLCMQEFSAEQGGFLPKQYSSLMMFLTLFFVMYLPT